MKNRIDKYIENHKGYVIELAKELCKIPSPSGHEKKKAEFIRRKLEQITCETIKIDPAGNVIFIHNAKRNEKMTVFAAHIDTVFDHNIKIKPLLQNRRIYAPSICDNSINAAALIFIIKAIKENMIIPDNKILFAFDVCEEGLGNLKGIRYIIDDMKDEIKEVIALDTGYEHVVNRAVGSKRYIVNITSSGGHSYKDFGAKNSIKEAASIIEKIYTIKVSNSPKCTYNIGQIKGGTSVNTIAGECEFNIDLRSEDQSLLDELDGRVLEIIGEAVTDKVKVQSSIIGQRPCGRLMPGSSLENRIIDARDKVGLDTEFISGSTDANIPLSIGIPAVAFGVCNGGGVHSLYEYIELDSLQTGLKNLVNFI